MDWTMVYDETGEEDFVIPQLMEDHHHESRLARLVDKLYSDEDDDAASEAMEHHRLLALATVMQDDHPSSSSNSCYSLEALYYLSINYILGVGVLGMPHAFAKSGFLLMFGILVLVSTISYMTVLWVAETGARYVKDHQRIHHESNVASKERYDVATEASSLLASSPQDISQVVRFEMIDLVQYYLGPIHTLIYRSVLIILMYVGLLAYTQVFCGAVRALLGVVVGHAVPQVVFALFVIPLSLLDLEEQVSVQSIMAYARFVAIFIMVAGSAVALFLDDDASNRNAPPYWAPPVPDKMSYFINMNGFGVAFSTALFSQLFQHSVPGLLRPLSSRHKQQAPKVFRYALGTTFSLYIILGSMAASYFGADTKSSINLNFAHFTFGLDMHNAHWAVVILVRICSSAVVIFPALDTISIFPLIVNTLGNSFHSDMGPSHIKCIAKWLVAVIPYDNECPATTAPNTTNTTACRRRRRRLYSDLELNHRKDMLERASKVATVTWRLVAAIPPLVGSLWATDLSFSLLLSGMAGVYVAFVAPALLQLYSCRNSSSSSTMMLHGWHSNVILTYPVILFALFALAMIFAQIEDAWKSMNEG